VAKSIPDVAELRVGDMLTFLAVVRSSSLTAAARERKVTPSQVSKAITRLETHFGRRLLDRGSRGVLLSDAGRRIAPTLEEVVAHLEQARGIDPDTAELTLGAPSYLQASLIPVLASVAGNLRIRGFELPPSLLRASAQDEGFDVLLLPGEPGHLPASWGMEVVGELRKVLFASPSLLAKLGRPPIPPAALLEHPFVSPVYRSQGRVVPVGDDCPLPPTQRRIGHQVQTIGVALDVAAATHQLVFGPTIAAQRHLKNGTLVEVPVAGWDVKESLAFACHVDRVSARIRAAISAALKTAMRTMHGRSTDIRAAQ
jgi:DNA-binding transcriptional LysR family regulator